MPKPEEREDRPVENASFVVDRSSAQMTEQKTNKSISLPVAKVFNFQACVKEIQHSRPVINHNFELEIEDKVQILTSDRNGCVNWVETIEYNHLAKAEWVEIHRTLKARGQQSGQRKVSFALNPWEDLAHSLADKKIEGLVQVADAKKVFHGETYRGLWVDDVRMAIEEKKLSEEGTVLNFEARFQPSFSLLKTGNKQTLEPISEGKFEAEITLINVLNENQKEVRRAITQPIKVSGKIMGQSLLIESEVKLPTHTKFGQIQLGLKLTALDAPETLKPFHGVFNIAEYDQIKGSFFSRLKSFFQDPLSPKTVEQYLTETESTTATARAQKEGSNNGTHQKAEVRVSPLRFDNIGFQQQEGLARSKVFSVSACFRAPVDSKPLRFQEFTIKKVNGTTEKRQSNEEGCVNWEDSVNYQLLDKECWQPKQVQISNANLGMNQTLELNVNPWSAGGAGFQDKRQIGEPKESCAKGPSRILLTSYSFEKRRIDYPIDSKLNVKLQKEGTLHLQARLKRPSLTQSTGFEETQLPPGKYLLRWAVVDAYVANLKEAAGKVYQTDEKWVQIDANGTIAESIRLETANIKAAGNTNSIYFELLPEFKSENFQISTYRGGITLANGRDNGVLEPMPASNESVILKLADLKIEDMKKRSELIERMSTKQFLASEQDLQLINLNQEQESKWLQQKLGNRPLPELQSALNSGKLLQQYAPKLCQHWFSDQPVLARDCSINSAKNPKLYFESQYRYFVKGVSKVQDLGSETRNLTVNHSFSLTRTVDVAEMTISGVSAGASLGIPKFAGIGGSLGGSVEYGYMFSNHDARSNTSSIAVGESLISEKLNFRIRATSYEKCAVLRVNSEIYVQSNAWPLSKIVQFFKGQKAKAATKGLLICEGQFRERPLEFVESYYILNQNQAGTTGVDTTSDQGRPLFMAIRGVLDHNRFVKLMASKLTIPEKSNSDTQAQQSGQSSVLPAFLIGVPNYPGQYLTNE